MPRLSASPTVPVGVFKTRRPDRATVVGLTFASIALRTLAWYFGGMFYQCGRVWACGLRTSRNGGRKNLINCPFLSREAHKRLRHCRYTKTIRHCPNFLHRNDANCLTPRLDILKLSFLCPIVPHEENCRTRVRNLPGAISRGGARLQRRNSLALPSPRLRAYLPRQSI